MQDKELTRANKYKIRETTRLVSAIQLITLGVVFCPPQLTNMCCCFFFTDTAESIGFLNAWRSGFQMKYAA